MVPYLMGPQGSKYARVGVQLTDSPYVVLNLRKMTRMGNVALRELARWPDSPPAAQQLDLYRNGSIEFVDTYAVRRIHRRQARARPTESRARHRGFLGPLDREPPDPNRSRSVAGDLLEHHRHSGIRAPHRRPSALPSKGDVRPTHDLAPACGDRRTRRSSSATQTDVRCILAGGRRRPQPWVFAGRRMARRRPPTAVELSTIAA